MKSLGVALLTILGAVVASCQVGHTEDIQTTEAAAAIADQSSMPASAPVLTRGDAPPGERPEAPVLLSFGCNGPFDHHAEICDRHCRNDLHCRGGYCDAETGWFRCTCFGC